MTNDFIEITKLIMIAGWLVVMAITDIQSRNVPNKFFKWFFMMSFGFILYNLQNPLPVVISFGITSIIAVVLYNLKGIGGADVKLLMILSMLYPIPVNSFPFALLVFGVAGVGVGIWGFIQSIRNDQTLDDIKNTRVPFVPFVMIGYFVLVITVF